MAHILLTYLDPRLLLLRLLRGQGERLQRCQLSRTLLHKEQHRKLAWVRRLHRRLQRGLDRGVQRRVRLLAPGISLLEDSRLPGWSWWRNSDPKEWGRRVLSQAWGRCVDACG